MRRLVLLLLVLGLASCDSGLTNGKGRIYPGGGSFGWSLALDGEEAVVPALNTGEGFVLEKQADGWSVASHLTPSPSRLETFGWDAAIEDGIAVVGAPDYGSRTNLPSAAVVYERSGSEWREVAILSPDDMLQPDGQTAGAIFGFPLDLSDGRIVSSSRWRDADRYYNRVHIYERVGGAWTETARIEDPAPEPPHLDQASGFGSGLAISGDRLAVSSPGQDVNGEQDAGLVRVYRRDGADWVLEATLTNPTGERSGSIGRVLAMDGPVLAVKASRGVWIYRRTGTSWAFEAELALPEERAGIDRALDVDGDRVAAGAWNARDYRGSAYVWARQASGAWVVEAEVGPEGYGSGTGFGESVGISGDRLMVGAAAMSGSRGGAFEFRREGTDWVQVK